MRALTEVELEVIKPIVKTLAERVELLSFKHPPEHVWLAQLVILASYEKEHGFSPNDVMILDESFL